MNNFIVWGATGQAVVLEELLKYQNGNILAFFENNPSIKSPFDNIPIFYGKEGFEEWKKTNSTKDFNFLVAIGGSRGNEREEIFEYLTSKSISTKAVIHSTSFIASNAIIGEGSQILAKSSICARSILGKSVIVNTAASIDHECIIGDFVHIAPGATVCGCVKIGKNSFIGANATILPHLTIGQNSVIGAGTIITKNVPDNVVIRQNISNIILERNK